MTNDGRILFAKGKIKKCFGDETIGFKNKTPFVSGNSNILYDIPYSGLKIGGVERMGWLGTENGYEYTNGEGRYGLNIYPGGVNFPDLETPRYRKAYQMDRISENWYGAGSFEPLKELNINWYVYGDLEW